MGSSTTNYTGVSTKHLLSTVIFPDFMYLYIRANKMNKFNKLLNKINFTESYIWDMVLKYLLEPSQGLNMLH